MHFWLKISILNPPLYFLAAPSVPKDLIVSSTNNNEINVEWRTPEFINGQLMNYQIQILELPGEDSDIFEAEPSANEFTFTNLKSGTTYLIRVGKRTL